MQTQSPVQPPFGSNMPPPNSNAPEPARGPAAGSLLGQESFRGPQGQPGYGSYPPGGSNGALQMAPPQGQQYPGHGPPTNEMPRSERTFQRPVFGVSLEELFQRDGSAVPAPVYQCLQAVDLFGLEVEGIYRLSGTASHVTKIKEMFDSGMIL